jgi:hypothetical protein
MALSLFVERGLLSGLPDDAASTLALLGRFGVIARHFVLGTDTVHERAARA